MLIKNAIKQRALEVERPGYPWEWFDGISWGCESKTRVTIFCGEATLDLFEIFTSREVSARAAAWPSHAYVVASQGDRHMAEADARAYSKGDLRANHFIYARFIGVAAGRMLADLRTAELAERQASTAESVESAQSADSAESADYSSERRADLMNLYNRLGFHLVFTNYTGDCAPDACCVHATEERTPVGWKSQRRRVAEFQRTTAGEVWFQDCYVACAESLGPVGSPSAAATMPELYYPGPPSPSASANEEDEDEDASADKQDADGCAKTKMFGVQNICIRKVWEARFQRRKAAPTPTMMGPSFRRPRRLKKAGPN